MTDPQICRICLNTGVTMYDYDRHSLMKYYEEITSSTVESEDSLPKQFCYECAALLYKYHKFKEKCHRGQDLLNNILITGPITSISICMVDRQKNNLKSPINILLPSKRVKSYSVKSKHMCRKKKEYCIEERIEEIVLPEYSENITMSQDVLEDISEVIIDNVPQNITEVILNDDDIHYNDKIYVVDGLNDNETEHIANESEDKADISVNEEKVNTSEDDVINEVFQDTDSDSEDVKYDAVNIEDIKIDVNDLNDENSETGQSNSKTKRKHSKINKEQNGSTEKQFERRKTEFDPRFWLKVTLNEDQAMEDFIGRSQDTKYLSAAYKCTSCYKGFSREDMLIRHNKFRHNQECKLSCKFCGMRFNRESLLTKHMTMHYVKYRCLRCDLIFDRETSAFFHNDFHNGVIRKCEHCGDEFAHQSTYYTHLRNHRSEHVCTICGESYVNAMGLLRHKKSMHVDGLNSGEAESIYCEKCDIRFETRKAYDQHLYHSARHGDVTTPVGQNISPAPHKVNKNNLMTKGVDRRPRKQTPCNVCGENFSTYRAYSRHHSLAHPGEPLAPHAGARPGTKPERYICEICGISLARCSVAQHLNIHTQSIRYPCSTCGRNFNSKTVLKQHHLTHTSEKPVACPLCDKRFKQSGSMKLHYRTFHLKEPYPKRNRNKKRDELMKIEDYSQDLD